MPNADSGLTREAGDPTIGLAALVFHFMLAFFKSRQRREAENAALRQQLIVLARRAPKRLQLAEAEGRAGTAEAQSSLSADSSASSTLNRSRSLPDGL